jgi:hypothetical protein
MQLWIWKAVFHEGSWQPTYQALSSGCLQMAADSRLIYLKLFGYVDLTHAFLTQGHYPSKG